MVNVMVFCSLYTLGVCDNPSCDENPNCEALRPHPRLHNLLRIRLVPREGGRVVRVDARMQIMNDHSPITHDDSASDGHARSPATKDDLVLMPRYPF